MKKYDFLWLALVFTVLGCGSAERTPCTETVVTTKAPSEEVATLKQYIDSAGIKATADERGFYYTIDTPGKGQKPTVCSNVTVNYTGKLTNGKTFDSANNSRFDLNQLIVGWQEGIPLIGEGGSVTLYLPPSLAYGAQAQNGIPANSILVFKIILVRVK